MASGHSWSSIKYYSLSEIGAFLKATVASNARDRKERLSYAWMGAHLDQKGLRKVLADMDKVIKQTLKPDDPKFVESEWQRLMSFQRGIR